MEEPRDELIDSTSSMMPNQTVPATAEQIDQAAGNEDAAPANAKSATASLSENASKVAKSLKPVAEAAESLAGHAVSLSAKGINWLDSILVERKQNRAANAESAPLNDAE